MPTDATGAPTALGIPTYNTSVDAPSGLGFNAAMAAIDTIITAKQLPTATGSNKVPVWNGSSWVAQTVPPAAVTPGSAGQVLGTDTSGAVAWKGGMHLLADSLLVGSAGGIDLSGLSTNYKHLRIYASLRSDTAAVSTPALLRLNADATAANYFFERVSFAAATTSPSEVLGSSGAFTLGDMTATNAPAGAWANWIIDIPDYANGSKHRQINAAGGLKTAATTGTIQLQQMFGNWAGGAVTEVTFLPTAGSLIANSRVSVYGIG